MICQYKLHCTDKDYLPLLPAMEGADVDQVGISLSHMFTIGSTDQLYSEHSISKNQLRCGMSSKDILKHAAIEKVLRELGNVELNAMATMMKRYEDAPSTQTAADLVTQISCHMEKGNSQARGYLLWTKANKSTTQERPVPVSVGVDVNYVENLISSNSDVKSMLSWQMENRSVYASNIRKVLFSKEGIPAVTQSSELTSVAITDPLSDSDDEGDNTAAESDVLVLERLVDNLMLTRSSASKTAPLSKKQVFKKKKSKTRTLQQKAVPMIKASRCLIRDIKSGKVQDLKSTSKTLLNMFTISF